jgi:hypothetical protein
MKKSHVFINCPFSVDYQFQFRAIVFTAVRSGFTPRCALETDDGSDIRFHKICAIIADCRLGIHDISKTDLDKDSGMPRFNMPLELGLFLASKRFGTGPQKRKKCIIFDSAPYRYQKFISDIAGQDIHSHGNKPELLVEKLAGWFRDESPGQFVPGGKSILKDFQEFNSALPDLCAARLLDPSEMTFQDYHVAAARWIRTL